MKVLVNIWLFPVKLYQKLISPLLGPRCRYQPSCSHYMIGSVYEWGVVRGTWLGIKRIARCHPWGGMGADPVPKKNKL